MDRVKAAIFSSLGDKVVGARVLDLFAGSGGLGIEALSRGATDALFVDHDRKAIDAIERNLRKAKVEGQTRQQDVFEFLKRAIASHRQSGSGSLGQFDLIFADPPYEPMETGEHFTDKLLANEFIAQLLAEDGLFILEKRPDEVLPQMHCWNPVRQKTYGATEVLIVSANPESTNRKSKIKNRKSR
jgi:16S rRNA (guanine(966)-N(2))-methyltransferase RsmD